MREMDSEGENRVHPTQDNAIPCITWGMDLMPTRLPSIPPLPELLNTGVTKRSNDIKIVQIAAFDNHIVALTNMGHVLKYGSLHDENGVPRGRWEYVGILYAEQILSH